MTDKKDSPAKGSERSADRAPDGSGAKRPFATIDLKAIEVRTAVTKPAASATATPVSATGRPAAGQTTSSQSEAAAKVVAAARAMDAGKADAKAAANDTGAKIAAEAGAGASASSQASSPATGQATGPRICESAVEILGKATGDATAGTAGRTVAGGSPAQTKPRGGGLLTHLGAGLAGGALALAGLPFLAPLLGIDPTRPPSAVIGLAPDQAARLNVLEKQVRERLAAPLAIEPAKSIDAPRLDDMARQIGMLTEAQGKIVGENAALRDELTKQSALAGAGDRLAKLEEQLNTMTAAAVADPRNATRLPQLAQLTGQIAELKTALETRFTAQRRDMLKEIDDRVAASTVTAETAKAGAVRLDKELTDVKSDTTRLTQRVDQLKSGSDRTEQSLKSALDDAAALKTALDAFKIDVAGTLKTTARPTDVAMAVAPVSAKITSLETSVQNVIRAEEDRKANAERIVLSLELGNLKRAMDRGQKYASELAEVKKLAGGRIDLTALERFQAQGVPTVVDLARQFRLITNPILDADGEPADGTLVDRLLNGAKNVVRVRKTSHSPDDASAEAVVARMETALKESRLADVVSEAKKLSPKASAPAQDWLRQVDARYAVEAAVGAIDTALKTSLGAGPSPGPGASPGPSPGAGGDAQKGGK